MKRRAAMPLAGGYGKLVKKLAAGLAPSARDVYKGSAQGDEPHRRRLQRELLRGRSALAATWLRVAAEPANRGSVAAAPRRHVFWDGLSLMQAMLAVGRA